MEGGGGADIEGERGGGGFSAIITITKTIVGSSILCLPYILKTLGIVFGFIFLLINAIVGVVVVDLLLKCKDITKK